MAGNEKNREVWREAVSAKEDCLSAGELERFAEGVSAEGRSGAHLASCPRCQTELAMLKNFESATPSQDEGAAVTWIIARLGRNLSEQATRASAAGRLSPWRSFFHGPYSFAALAVAMILIFGISLYIFQPSQAPHLNVALNEPPVFRSQSVRLLEPAGDLDRLPANFRWEAYPGAKFYTIELTEVDGTRVWKETAQENVLAVTPALKSAIYQGKPLFWRVTALDASGRSIADSGKGRFRIVTVNN